MVRVAKNLMLVAGCAVLGLGAGFARAQQPVDSSVQASPTKPPAPAAAVDASAQASPTPPAPSTSSGPHIAAHTSIAVRLTSLASSARLKNGDTVAAVLTAPVRLSNGSSLPAGTKASLTVVATVPAGKIDSAGDFTLQVVRVGTVSVTTDIQEFKGKPAIRICRTAPRPRAPKPSCTLEPRSHFTCSLSQRCSYFFFRRSSTSSA